MLNFDFAYMYSNSPKGGNVDLFDTYELADNATFNNTLYGGSTCRQISIDNDLYKESTETLVLWALSNDPDVYFGRDQALLMVPSNDGT